MSTPREHCPYTDDVVARHLDGEALSFGAPQGDHLADCPTCQHELELARKLDAALAFASGTENDSDAAARVLAATMARPELNEEPAPAISDAPEHSDSIRSATPMLLAVAAAALTVGFAVAWQLRGDFGASPTTTDSATGTLPTVDPAGDPKVDDGPADPFGGLRLTRRPAGKSSPIALWSESGPATPRSAADVQRLEALVDPAALDQSLAFWQVRWNHSLGRNAMGLGAMDLADVDLAATRDGARLRVARALADSDLPQATAAWVRVAATVTGTEARNALVLDGRSHRGIQRTLIRHARSQNSALKAVAIWIGGRSIDEQLRRGARKDLDSAKAVAQQLANVAERPGRTQLLMAIWGDLYGRGLLSEDVDAATLLFGRQPKSATAELLAIARSDRNRSRRERALIGLAGRRDAVVLPRLLEWMEDPHRPEASLAALVLAQLPTAQLEHLAARASEPEEWLLRAALACAGLPIAQRWFQHMDLSIEEHRFLATGHFSREQFPIAVTLFHERPLIGFE